MSEHEWKPTGLVDTVIVSEGVMVGMDKDDNSKIHVRPSQDMIKDMVEIEDRLSYLANSASAVLGGLRQDRSKSQVGMEGVKTEIFRAWGGVRDILRQLGADTRR